jgi:hypothetical protein
MTRALHIAATLSLIAASFVLWEDYKATLKLNEAFDEVTQQFRENCAQMGGIFDEEKGCHIEWGKK